jgi:hypothetical protein
MLVLGVTSALKRNMSSQQHCEKLGCILHRCDKDGTASWQKLRNLLHCFFYLLHHHSGDLLFNFSNYPDPILSCFVNVDIQVACGLLIKNKNAYVAGHEFVKVGHRFSAAAATIIVRSLPSKVLMHCLAGSTYCRQIFGHVLHSCCDLLRHDCSLR